tara:strand:+ start:1652 stop:2800 length:1149 start_codon:yes stop_codon:yes gene_type:complete
MATKKNITILTRHYPPNKNINGILACEMAHYLETEHNSTVTILCMDTTASGNKKSVEPAGNVIQLKSYFKKENKFSKLFAIINEGYRLVKKAKEIQSDLIICSTSPPLLPFWASVLFKKKNNWALWSLDLFPEMFLANNQLKENSFIYKYLFKKTYRNAPNYLIALGEKQAKNIILKYNKQITTIILPAGVVLDSLTTSEENSPTWHNPDTITLGYFGNIGIAHNPSFIEKCIEQAQAKNYKFILAAYGVHSERVKNYSKQFSCVEIITNGLPQEHLKYIDIHLVSLMSNFTHIAVPSKAVTAISCGRPILFCGDEDSDNWQMFKKAGWLINEDSSIEMQLKSFFKEISKELIQKKSDLTANIYSGLQAQIKDTYSKIPSLV